MTAAAMFFCLVVGISDGDTLTAQCEAQAHGKAVTLKVRLSEIDAPALLNAARSPTLTVAHPVQGSHTPPFDPLILGIAKASGAA